MAAHLDCLSQTEAQELLFKDITFLVGDDAQDYEDKDEACSALFFATAQAKPRLAALVRSIQLAGGHAHCKRLLSYLATGSLPNLEIIDGLPWAVRCIGPAPVNLVQPYLKTLGLLQLDNVPPSSTAFPWFNLSNLRRLELTANYVDDDTLRALAAAPDTLEELNLSVMEVLDGPSLATAVARFAALQSLELAVQEWRTPLPLDGRDLACHVKVDKLF